MVNNSLKHVGEGTNACPKRKRAVPGTAGTALEAPVGDGMRGLTGPQAAAGMEPAVFLT